jgi:hypothetical protein
MRKRVVAAIFLSFFIFPFPAPCADEDWELGIEGGYFWPRADVEDFSPDYSFGAGVYYWMNDTSTLDMFVSQIITYDDLPVYEDSKETDYDRLSYETILLAIGVRYLPDLDVFFAPYLGMGLGLQMWTFDSDLVDRKGSMGIFYYGVAGGEYPLTRRLRINIWSRYVHCPFNERLERELYVDASGDVDSEREDLEASHFLMVGINLNLKVN